MAGPFPALLAEITLPRRSDGDLWESLGAECHYSRSRGGQEIGKVRLSDEYF